MPKQKIKWIKLFERRAETLIILQGAIGRKWYPETLGINFRPQNIKYEDGWYYLDAKEMKQEYLALKKKCEKEPKFLEQLPDRLYNRGKKLVSLAEEKSKNLKKKRKQELSAWFKQYNEAIGRYMPAAWSIFAIEKFLSEQLKNRLEKIYPNLKEEKYNKYFNALTTLPEKSTANLEYEALLRLAAEYKKSGSAPKMKQKIKQIHRKFKHLGAVRVGWTYLSEPYNLDHYESVIQELAGGNPMKELEKSEEKLATTRRVYQDFIKRPEINEKLIKAAELLQRYIFFRTARGEYFVKAMMNAKPLLREIASRLNLKFEDIVWFTPPEIIKALKTGKTPDFESGKQGFSLIMIGGKPTLVIEKEIKWVKEWTRGFFLIYWWTGIEAYTEKDVKEKYGLGIFNQMYLPEENGHSFYYGKDDYERFQEEILRRIKQDKYYLKREASSCKVRCEAMVNAMEKLTRNIGKKTNLELIPSYQKYLEEFKKYCFYLEMVHVVEIYLEKKIREELTKALGTNKGKEFANCFSAIATKIKKVAAEEAEIEKLKIATVMRKGKNANPLIKNYLEKFSWLTCYGLEQKPIEEQEILDEIKKIRNPQRRLNEEKKKFESQQNSLSKIRRKFRKNTNFLYWIDILQEYLFLRTYRTDALRRMLLFQRTFLQEVASRAGLDFKAMFYFRPEEIISFLKTGKLPPREELQRRKKHFAILVKNKKIKLYSKKQQIEKLKKQELKEKKEEITQLKGNTAQPGKVKGVVKIIKRKKDWHKLKNGDILVTTMTVPEMIPLIRKAGAIVTDEGGITCHAAITSRELGIPCVIATFVATKVLKDGDLVKVDATKGIIKKLKRDD